VDTILYVVGNSNITL